MESICLKAMTCSIKSSIMKVNAGSNKVNHSTCSTMKILLNRKKLPYAQLWNLFKGSLDIQSRHNKSRRGFAVRAEAAAGFPETDDAGEKMVVKSEFKLSDSGSNVEGFMGSQTGGSDIGDGDGGHRHGGKNGGGDSNNNNSDGYEDSEHSDRKLINTVWWLVLFCIRMLRITSTMWNNDSSCLVWLVAAFEFVAAKLMISTSSIAPLMAPSVPAVREVMEILFSGFVWFLTELETSLRVFMCMMLAGFAAVLDWCAF